MSQAYETNIKLFNIKYFLQSQYYYLFFTKFDILSYNNQLNAQFQRAILNLKHCFCQIFRCFIDHYHEKND